MNAFVSKAGGLSFKKSVIMLLLSRNCCGISSQRALQVQRREDEPCQLYRDSLWRDSAGSNERFEVSLLSTQRS